MRRTPETSETARSARIIFHCLMVPFVLEMGSGITRRRARHVPIDWLKTNFNVEEKEKP